MTQIRFTQEFKQEAVRQVVDRGNPVGEVAARLGVSPHSLYTRIRQHNKPAAATVAEAEIKRLQAELRRVTVERDILKKGRRVLCQRVSVRCAFIHDQFSSHDW